MDRMDEHLLELFSMGNDLYNKFPWAFQAASRKDRYRDLTDKKLPFRRYAQMFERHIRDVPAYGTWLRTYNEAYAKYTSWQKKRTQAETDGNIPDNHSARKRPRKRKSGN